MRCTNLEQPKKSPDCLNMLNGTNLTLSYEVDQDIDILNY